MTATRVVTKCEPGSGGSAAVDAITTEVIRNGLNSAAQQMRRALIRHRVLADLYEMVDFAVALYDRRGAPCSPSLSGLADLHGLPRLRDRGGGRRPVGGEKALEPGDILLLQTIPYHDRLSPAGRGDR